MMKRGLNGKTFSCGRPPEGILPQILKMVMCSLLTSPFKPSCLHAPGACVLFTAVTVLNVASCNRDPGLQSMKHPQETTVHINCPYPYGHIDVFIYSDTLSRPLQSHMRLAGKKFFAIDADGGDKLIAAIANVEGEFRENALATFAQIEGITASYSTENPDAPLLSGYTSARAAAGSTCELTLLPLLCPVETGRISISGDAALTDPVISLEGVNGQARLMQSEGFHPTSTLESARSLRYPQMMERPLDFDVGNSPRETGVTLWCYPNETGDGPAGGGTVLIVSGMLRGQDTSFRIPLGIIRRGTKVSLDISL